MSAIPAQAAPASNWQASFLAMLPAIKRQARRALRKCPLAEREEALQFIIASAAVAFARLAKLNRLQLAYPGPLARYGFKQYQAGRLIGGSSNCHDVSSRMCQRRQGCVVESLDDWQESLAETRRTTPADLAALRVDFAAWLESLSPRNQQLARTLARGEEAGVVAEMFRITAARVSQLRRELYESWQRFVGEPVRACG